MMALWQYTSGTFKQNRRRHSTIKIWNMTNDWDWWKKNNNNIVVWPERSCPELRQDINKNEQIKKMLKVTRGITETKGNIN